MNPIPAKFAGTCAKTGERYAAGDLIVKNSDGKWQIARDRRGRAKVAPPQPEFRTVRTPDGEIKQNYNIHQTPLCGYCCKADGLLDTLRNGNGDRTPYLMPRSGDDFLHERCGRRVHILNDAEIWAEVTLPNLHFTDDLSLNLKVGPGIWGKIAHFFQYDSYADLAEYYEDVDEFDMAHQYEGMRGGRWSLKNSSNLEQVEGLLGILPANRLAVLRVQWAEDQAREREEERVRLEAARALEQAKRTLFAPDQGQYVPIGPDFDGRVQGQTVPWKDGHNLYGGGEEFILQEGGRYIWHSLNNGADGDDWSRNNLSTGGAGAIGRRFDATPERMEFLRSLPGGEMLGRSYEERRAILITQIRDQAFAAVSPEIQALFLHELPEPVKIDPAVWVRIDGIHFGMPPNGAHIYARVKIPNYSDRHDEYRDAGVDGWNGLTLRYTPNPERIQRLQALWPAWVGTTLPGRFRLGSGLSMSLTDNAADALRTASHKEFPVTDVVFTPDVTLVHQDGAVAIWSDGVVNKIHSYTLFSDARKQIDARRREADADAARAARGEPPLDRTPLYNFEDLGFPPVPSPVEAQTSISPDASKLLRIALTQSRWREGGRYRDLFAVTRLVESKRLQKRDDRNTGAELFRLTVEFGEGDIRTLYQVDSYWVSRGEDADVGEDSYLYTADEEAEAVETYDTANVLP